MAKATNVIVVTEAWLPLTTVQATCLVSMSGANPGYVQIALADALGDLVQGDEGHRMGGTDAGVINFYGLGSKKVFAKLSRSDRPVSLIVTAF